MAKFTVVMATYNRGRHILPSIRSVLQQRCQDFELLVVGDSCTDDTAAVVRSLASPQIRWLNLATRCGSQSFPNNAGIEAAQGHYIAYIGHDDIWARDHLDALDKVFKNDSPPDFAVSGAIYHGPRASNYRLVTGIFSDSSAALTNFFPPSSFAHRRDVTDRIGSWRNPREIVPPVDSEFLLRAAKAGMQFASTQRVTVQKFAAGHRYLSYVRHASDEQERMIRRMSAPGYDGYLASEIARSKAAKTFMIASYLDFTQYGKGQLAAQNAQNKGLVRPELCSLSQREVIVQDNSPRALDWLPFEAGDDGIRWVGRNPRPKLLLPFKYAGPARIGLNVWHAKAEALDRLRLSVNGRPVVARISQLRRAGTLWQADATFEAPLQRADYTVLELHLNKLQRSAGQTKGIGVANIAIEPLGWRRLAGRLGQLLAKLRPVR